MGDLACWPQSSPSRFRAGKTRDHPTVHAGVALQAVHRISQRLMIRRTGFLEGPQMTTHAFGRESLAIELPYRADPVTRITIHRGVRSDQRKTILMFIDGMD
jgi:hypothetical protein